MVTCCKGLPGCATTAEVCVRGHELGRHADVAFVDAITNIEEKFAKPYPLKHIIELMRRLALFASFLPLACGSSKESSQDPPVREVALDCRNALNAAGAARPAADPQIVWIQHETTGVVSEDGGATYHPFDTGLSGALSGGGTIHPVALYGSIAYIFKSGAKQPRVSEDGGRTWVDAAFARASYPGLPSSIPGRRERPSRWRTESSSCE